MSEWVEFNAIYGRAQEFLLEACMKTDPSFERIPTGKGGLNVTLTVEGVEVPFAATLESILRREFDAINERAAAIAADKYTLDGYPEILRTIENFNDELKRQVRKTFNCSLPDDDDD